MRIFPFAALLLCGCYVSAPLATTAPEPGTRLHVQLTDAGSADLARYIGPNVVAVDGRLLQNSDSAISLSVSNVAMRSGVEQFWKGESVTLPRNAIATVQRKKLSVWRSGLVGSALVAGIVAISGVAGGGNGSDRGGGPPPQPK
jgi:hypothetical protein